MYTNVNAASTTTRSLSLTCTDVTDDAGKTPLDWAVLGGHTEVSEDLDWAVLGGHTEVSEYLKSLRKQSTPEPGMCVLY